MSQPIQVADQPQQQPNVRFTEQDIERARQQEKEKLYPRIEEMSAQLKQLRRPNVRPKQAERQRLADEAEAARRAKEESEMDLRDLFEKREAEFHNADRGTQPALRYRSGHLRT